MLNFFRRQFATDAANIFGCVAALQVRQAVFASSPIRDQPSAELFYGCQVVVDGPLSESALFQLAEFALNTTGGNICNETELTAVNDASNASFDELPVVRRAASIVQATDEIVDVLCQRGTECQLSNGSTRPADCSNAFRSKSWSICRATVFIRGKSDTMLNSFGVTVAAIP